MVTEILAGSMVGVSASHSAAVRFEVFTTAPGAPGVPGNGRLLDVELHLNRRIFEEQGSGFDEDLLVGRKLPHEDVA